MITKFWFDYIKQDLRGFQPWIEISVNTDISVLGFQEYIGNIKEISVDIFTQISVRQKLSKIDGNAQKNPNNDKISKNMHVKVIL